MLKQLIVLGICIANQIPAASQGCSDAGFCSIGNLQNETPASAKALQHRLSILAPVGVGDENVLVISPTLEYNLGINRWNLQARLASNYASGNLGTAVGFSDIYFVGTYMVNQGQKWRTSVTLAAKIPLNQANIMSNDLPLPMQYQSSLGTFDLITGISVSSDRLQFSAGWQQPLSGRNGNNFLPAYHNEMKADRYPPSNDFNRKGDVLLRSSYFIGVSTRIRVDAGLLAIYHLAEDTYIDGNLSNLPIPIQGSKGLTLNLTGAIHYQVSPKMSIDIAGGIPLVVRNVRPDGLTRQFVIIPQVNIHF